MGIGKVQQKHIICTKKLPGLLDVNKYICRFLDKVKWRWIHKDNESELPVVRVKHKRRVDNPCHLITTPLLQCWCDSVRQKILAECKQSINKSKHNRSFQNFKKLIKWGTQSLKQKLGLRVFTNRQRWRLCIRRSRNSDKGH